MLTDSALAAEKQQTFGACPGVQRLYKMPNGFGLSVVNNPILHSRPYAWKIVVVSDMHDDGSFNEITYDTPLTSVVYQPEVFYTDDDANEFIAKAIEWAMTDKA